jgi:hypothetical protein
MNGFEAVSSFPPPPRPFLLVMCGYDCSGYHFFFFIVIDHNFYFDVYCHSLSTPSLAPFERSSSNPTLRALVETNAEAKANTNVEMTGTGLNTFTLLNLINLSFPKNACNLDNFLMCLICERGARESACGG